MNVLAEIKPSVKTGSEQFSDDGSVLDFTLLDYWKWGMSHILSNTERGALAEFIVASAVGFDQPVRNDWGEYDLTADNGRIKIEVKSSAYIQVWEQKGLSNIVFGIRVPKSTKLRASDVYVFCLLKHKDQNTIDPLRLEQWEFYVVPTNTINRYERSQSSITLNSLQKLTDAACYSELKSKIYEQVKQQ